MIPEYVKDQILEHDIVSIIQGEGIHLTKKGVNYECCCPFHNEKTPSFKVSPVRNIYHCFGACDETGNAIDFIMHLKNMKFYEALEYLADKLGIQYEKHEPTAEERERRFHRSALMEANKVAVEYFRECLAKSPAASEYARNRWKKSTLDLFMIGYAPEHGGLLKYCTDRGYKTDILLEAGLIKRSDRDHSLYDTFRHRIMFPIYSRTGNVIGFSGRYIGAKDYPKYLNTGETLLYSKSKEIFGLFHALRQITTTETAVLVEGNPDVVRLHEIGVNTAIAPLGTALTADQISIIKKYARTVILIGDTDDAGVKAVKKHGVDLLRNGLNVRVMILPEGKDPDEYFKLHHQDYDDCLTRHTYDYIPWICHERMKEQQSQTEIAAVITEICQLLALVQDQTTVDMYISTFTKEYKNGKIWTQEYYKAKNAIDRQKVKEKTDGFEDMLAEYGFYVRDNCYYGAASRANDKRWSNFILIPIVHIRDERNARRIFLMRNVKRQEAVIKFAQSELVSFTDFKTRVETKGNYVWEAGPGELTLLKKFLYDDTPSADEIKQLGWQKRYQFYAWGNGGLDCGHFEKADEFGIVNMRGQKFYLPGCSLDTRDDTQGYQHQRKFIYAVTNDITLHDYAVKLITVFGDNAKIALCFLFATLFKDIVTSVTTSFPILNLFGPKGTGKSELGHSLTSFFIPNNIAPNINNTTKAALAEAVAEVSNAVVHLDEYKNSLELEKREFLKGLWDGAGRSRMNMDNDKKRETTAVDCGVVMSGQDMPTADIALFNRIVFLTFSKSEFTDQEKRNYEDLKLIEKRGLTHLTGEVLKLRQRFQGNFRSAWDAVLYDLSNNVRKYAVEDRTLKNWATLLAAFKSLEPHINMPFNYNEMLGIMSNLCVEQNNKTKQNNELSGFWETVDILVSSSKIWIKVDYHIKMGTGTGRPIPIQQSKTPLELRPDKKYLYINFSRISQLYAKEGRDTAGKTIPRDTLKYYLEHSPEFLGTAKSMRFKMIETPQGYTPSDGDTAKSKVTTAMIFDYDMIKENYNIDIDISSGYTENDDEEKF